MDRRAGSAWRSRPRSRSSGRRSSAREVPSRATASSVSAICRNCSGLQAAAAGGALHPRPDVVRRADADAGALAQQRAGLVRLVEAAVDEDRVRLRLERLGEPAAGRERGQLREPGADLRELEQRDGALVHQAPSAGTRSPGHGWARRIDEPPGMLAPRGRGVVDADPRRGDDRGAARSVRRGRVPGAAATGSHRSRPVSDRSIPNATVTRPGPAGQAVVGQAAEPVCAVGRRPSAPQRPVDACGAHELDALDRLDGANQQRGGAAVGLRDHVQAVVHPVDKVHVGQAGRPEHDRVARGPSESRVGREVVRADVRLDLDDPPDPPAPVVVADQARAEQGPRRHRASAPASASRASGGLAPVSPGRARGHPRG